MARYESYELLRRLLFSHMRDNRSVQVDEKLIDVLTSSFEEIWVIAEKNKCDLRTASLIKGIKRVAAAKLTRGLFP